MAITDLRTVIDDGTDNTNWEDVAGGGFGNNNSDTAPPGATASVTEKISSTIGGLLYNTGGTGNFAAGDHLYLWYSTLFGAIDTQASGGIRVRVTGATVTDWAEVYVDGSDSGRSGWQLAVVGLDELLANPDGTNGTPPTAANVQRVGVVWDVTGMVTGNNDNVAVQSIFRSPSSLDGAYRVDAGTDGTPNTWQDVADQVNTDATGVVVKELNGTFTLRGPIVFGPASGNTDTTFDDTNVVLAWDGQEFVEDDFYGMRMVLPASYTGDARLTAGARVGSGDSSLGVGGWTILSGGPRWFMEFNDTDATDVQFFGCSFTGSGPWAIDDTAVEIRSSTFSDCDTLTHNNACTVVKCFFASAPGPGPQIDLLDDPASSDFFECGFVNMSWWAIEISESATTTYSLRGITYANNGTDRDILLSHTSGDLTLAVVDSPNGVAGDTPGVTNGASITVTTSGACEQIAVTAVGFDNVNETTPTPETNSATGTGTLTAGVTPDDANSYAIAAYANDDYGTVDWSGSSAYTEEVDKQDLTTLSLLSGASKTGVTGLQTASAAPSSTPTTGALAVAEVDSEAASAVTQVDPAWRPVEGTPASATHVFSYGVAHDLASPSSSLAAFVMIQALDTATAGDSAISTVSWGGTNMTSVVSADDSANGVRTHIYELRGDDLRKGTFSVEANVNIEIIGVTEGARCIIKDEVGDSELMNDLAFTDDGQGAFKATATFNYSTDTAVRVSAASSGKVVAGVADDTAVFTDETVQANDSRTGAGETMTLIPTASPATPDGFYFGHTESFLQMDLDVLTAGAGTYTLAWEYWNGGSWASLPGLSDGTNNYKNAGSNRISWTTPGSWAATTVTNQPGSTSLFYIRARFVSGTVTTTPVGRTAQLDVTKYRRWETTATITSTGLSAKATWVEDTIATF